MYFDVKSNEKHAFRLEFYMSVSTLMGYDNYLGSYNALKLFSEIIFWYGFVETTTARRDLFISGFFEVSRALSLSPTLQNKKFSKPDQKFSNCIFNPR